MCKQKQKERKKKKNNQLWNILIAFLNFVQLVALIVLENAKNSFKKESCALAQRFVRIRILFVETETFSKNHSYLL